MQSTIQFYFALDKGRLEVLLEADVEYDGPRIFYQVKNFRMPGSSSARILPDIKIKKRDGRWVHGDSGWFTELSEAAGKAIDKIGLAAIVADVWELRADVAGEQSADAAEGAA